MKRYLKSLMLKVCFPKEVDFFSRTMRVVSGPFLGVRFPLYSCAAKLLGTYELELHGIVRTILDLRFDRIVNIGAGDGYYAIGLAATSRAGTDVIAFEEDSNRRADLAMAAKINGVNKVAIHGRCEADQLRTALHGNNRNLVVCDIEGYEQVLLDSESVEELRDAWILVELHNLSGHDTYQTISERFENTHRLEEICGTLRCVEHVPVGTGIGRIFADRLLLKALDEQRPELMRWLWMTPLNASGTERINGNGSLSASKASCAKSIKSRPATQN